LSSKRIPRPEPPLLEPAPLRESFAHRMMYSVAKDAYTASDYDVYHALAYAVRDRTGGSGRRTPTTSRT
jgi:hypothetical protein